MMKSCKDYYELPTYNAAVGVYGSTYLGIPHGDGDEIIRYMGLIDTPLIWEYFLLAFVIQKKYLLQPPNEWVCLKNDLQMPIRWIKNHHPEIMFDPKTKVILGWFNNENEAHMKILKDMHDDDYLLIYNDRETDHFIMDIYENYYIPAWKAKYPELIERCHNNPEEYLPYLEKLCLGKHVLFFCMLIVKIK